MAAQPREDNQVRERRPIADEFVLARLRRASGAAEADEKGLQMTTESRFLTCALTLCLVMVVHAQPVPETTRRADSPSAWGDTCSLSAHGASVRWGVGDSGKVLKAVGGDTTAEYTIGRGQFDLFGVTFADTNHGWIVGSKREDPGRGRGVIFSTETAGNCPKAWIASCPVIRPDVNVPFLSVQAMDIRHVLVACGDGYRLWSNDGGMRWAVMARRNTSGLSTRGPLGGDHGK